jgi:alpha-amylase
VLDAQYNATAVGTRLWAYSANGSVAQKFTLTHVSADYYALTCLNSGLAVAVSSGKVVLVKTDQSQDSQLWKLAPAGNGRFYLLNKSNEKALDVTNASAASGTYVQPFSPNWTKAQQWSFEATSWSKG